MARPSDYNQSIADTICELLADGKSLREICLSDDMPNRATVFRWLDAKKEFSDQYARAREEQAETLADEMLSIIDDAAEPLLVENIPMMIDGKPVMIASATSIAHARLKMDARKWIASKLKPKKYGDKIQTELSGEINVGFHEILVKARERSGS